MLLYQAQGLDCDTDFGKVVLSLPPGFRNLYLFQTRERKFVVHPVFNLDHIFMADLELFCEHAQFGQNVKFTNFYGV